MANDTSTFIAELGYLIDQFDELQDLRYSDLQYLDEYRTLKMRKNDGETINQARLSELEPIFQNKIVTSARWNKFQNALLGMQNFIKNEVQDYVIGKQNEVLTTVINGKNTINTAKDNALISIEQKKDNIIEYMDSTTAGQIRNDIGVIGELTTTDKASLVNAINEVTTNINDKVDKVIDKGLSTNDYTTLEKNKLAGIANNANNYSHPGSGTNPHNTTKTDIGLSNVTNDKQMPISGGVLENYREKLVALSGTTTAINLLNGNTFTHTLSGNTTYSISNAVSGQAHSFTLIITQTSTVRTITFPASVKWQGDEIPDLTVDSKTYILTFVTVNGGTTWHGMFGGEF